LDTEELKARVLIEHYLNVCVPGFPRISEHFIPGSGKFLGSGIAKKLERTPERLAPLLVPSFISASVTATITRPAPQPVHTAPGTSLTTDSMLNLYTKPG
jgi:hypothetical protein